VLAVNEKTSCSRGTPIKRMYARFLGVSWFPTHSSLFVFLSKIYVLWG
jgi:hypothetical protein